MIASWCLVLNYKFQDVFHYTTDRNKSMYFIDRSKIIVPNISHIRVSTYITKCYFEFMNLVIEFFFFCVQSLLVVLAGNFRSFHRSIFLCLLGSAGLGCDGGWFISKHFMYTEEIEIEQLRIIVLVRADFLVPKWTHPKQKSLDMRMHVHLRDLLSYFVWANVVRHSNSE
jgi:hypothetical protein